MLNSLRRGESRLQCVREFLEYRPAEDGQLVNPMRVGARGRILCPAMRRRFMVPVVNVFPVYNELAPFEPRRRSENSSPSVFVLEDGCEGSVVASRQIK